MSRGSHSRSARRERAPAAVFAALGDPTRLALIAKLGSGPPRSIAQLTQGTALTRQAITKHLHVLQRADIVHSLHEGRETLFALDARPLAEARSYLEQVSAEWDRALARLKEFVER